MLNLKIISKKSFSLISALTFLTIHATSANAACTQNRAIYNDSEQNFTLTFSPEIKNEEPASGSTFTITANDNPDFKLDGNVSWGDEISRPNTVITYNCNNLTTDTVTADDEFNDCTLWQGVVYSLTEGANAELLPRSDEPAAAALLFPDFLSMIESYDFGSAKPIEALQSEVFRFKACTAED